MSISTKGSQIYLGNAAFSVGLARSLNVGNSPYFKNRLRGADDAECQEWVAAVCKGVGRLVNIIAHAHANLPRKFSFYATIPLPYIQAA